MRACRKRPTPLEKKARRLFRPAIGVCQVRAAPAGFGEGRNNRSDGPVNGRIVSDAGTHARHIKKIIVKPCAGKRHARFERGFMETGRPRGRYRAIIYQ